MSFVLVIVLVLVLLNAGVTAVGRSAKRGTKEFIGLFQKKDEK